MVYILGFLVAFIALMSLTQTRSSVSGNIFPISNVAKREFEIFSLSYTCCWIAVFAVVILYQMYETFDEVCTIEYLVLQSWTGLSIIILFILEILYDSLRIFSYSVPTTTDSVPNDVGKK